MNVRHLVTRTELGPVTIVADGTAITGVYFPPHVYQPRRPRIAPETFGRRVAPGQDKLLDAAIRQLDNYLAGRRMDFPLPTTIPDVDGDPIHLSVWDLVTHVQRSRATAQIPARRP